VETRHDHAVKRPQRAPDRAQDDEGRLMFTHYLARNDHLDLLCDRLAEATGRPAYVASMLWASPNRLVRPPGKEGYQTLSVLDLFLSKWCYGPFLGYIDTRDGSFSTVGTTIPAEFRRERFDLGDAEHLHLIYPLHAGERVKHASHTRRCPKNCEDSHQYLDRSDPYFHSILLLYLKLFLFVLHLYRKFQNDIVYRHHFLVYLK
jgi:hypothetical protein